MLKPELYELGKKFASAPTFRLDQLAEAAGHSILLKSYEKVYSYPASLAGPRAVRSTSAGNSGSNSCCDRPAQYA